jgi:hypothetical protein
MTRQYTDSSTVELFLSDAFQATIADINNSFSVQMTLYIEQMTAFIESETGRQFVADTVASVRLFEVEGGDSGEVGRYTFAPNELSIDEAVSVTKLETKGAIDDTFVEISSDKWLTYPANRTPKVRLFVDEGATTQLKIGRQNIRVTAKWGYSIACPDDIKFACTVLVAGILQYSHRHQGQQTSLTMGRYQVAYRNEAQLGSYKQALGIIESYKRNSIV